jgi:hypothetical protein
VQTELAGAEWLGWRGVAGTKSWWLAGWFVFWKEKVEKKGKI